MEYANALRACIGRTWQPGIGDPNVTGWLTVAAYLLCLGLAVTVSRRITDPTARRFWMVVGVLMLALAINKQLDLQSALTAAGRCLARAQGWYGERRVVQVGVILGILSLLVLGLLIGLRALRGRIRQNGVALAGLAVLCAFVATRAVGFHHMDALLGRHPLGASVNYVFENMGLLLIALNAVAIVRRERRVTDADDHRLRPLRPSSRGCRSDDR